MMSGDWSALSLQTQAFAIGRTLCVHNTNNNCLNIRCIRETVYKREQLRTAACNYYYVQEYLNLTQQLTGEHFGLVVTLRGG